MSITLDTLLHSQLKWDYRLMPLPFPFPPWGCSLCGFLIVSSIERMRHAASVALARALRFTIAGSQIYAFMVSMVEQL